MKRYKFLILIVCFSIIEFTITGCDYNLFSYKKYSVLSMSDKETKYETDKIEKYLKEKYPGDKFAIDNIISEAYPQFQHPIYTINCTDITRNIIFYIRDRQKQLQGEPLADSLEFCINSNKKESNKKEEKEKIKTEISKYFYISNKTDSSEVAADDLDGGSVYISIIITGKKCHKAILKLKRI